jgi:hypothetical protein
MPRPNGGVLLRGVLLKLDQLPATSPGRGIPPKPKVPSETKGHSLGNQRLPSETKGHSIASQRVPSEPKGIRSSSFLKSSSPGPRRRRIRMRHEAPPAACLILPHSADGDSLLIRTCAVSSWPHLHPDWSVKRDRIVACLDWKLGWDGLSAICLS